MKEETIKKIKNFMNEYDDLEVEFRLGNKYTDTFTSDITKKNYEIIMNKLEKSYKKGIFEKEVKRIEDIFYNGKRISKCDNKVISIIKKKIFKEDVKFEDSPMDIRISVSREIEQILDENEILEENVFRRNKMRTVFIYKNWNYELTEVVTLKNGIEETTYEFELEIRDINEIKKTSDKDKLLVSSYNKICDVIGFIKDSG